MPELPEVEAIRRSLLENIDASYISEIIIYHPDVLLNIENFSLKNWKIQNIRRRGKYLLFDLQKYFDVLNPPSENNKAFNSISKETKAINQNSSFSNDPSISQKMTMLIHLRMTGKLLIEEKDVLPAKHTHVRFVFENGKSLDFNDVRRFGRIKLFKPGEEFQDQGLANLGPEPLGDEFTNDYFLKACQHHSKSQIKSLLLNQKVIAGIGNIYADESLFRAKIRPDRLIGDISQKELINLHQIIPDILEEAIGHRGTSFRDYVDGFGNKGFFQLQLAVYHKTGQPCPICKTPIQKIKVAGRSSHFCPHCQK